MNRSESVFWNWIKVGDLSTKSHGVSGTVYILDDKKVLISGFSYDGT